MSEKMIQNKAKEAAGKIAADFVEAGMTVGLGTGSTVAYFIASLGKRCAEGLNIKAVCSSVRTEEQARKAKIPIVDINSLTALDLVVDGADEIDPHKRMIKGGGGALLREKILAAMGKEMIVIVDESKCVKVLGACPLPVEILSFASHATLSKLNRKGFNPVLRLKEPAVPFITDNGNYVADLHLKGIKNPEEIDHVLHSIPGILETGLFLNLAGPVIIGLNDGNVKILR